MEGKLQVISGRYRGKKLKIPANARPAQQKARGAVFNMLNDIISAPRRPISPPDDGGRGAAADIGDIVVWDAFAGSGAMGLEFVSRFGAAAAIFTDTDSNAVSCIRGNMKNVSGCDIVIEQKDALCNLQFMIHNYKNSRHVVFIDPPYSAPELGEKLAAELAASAPAGAIIVWDTEGSAQVAFDSARLEVVRDKTYGRARFLILRKNLIEKSSEI
jgi:16S rRNA (guanine966-N2)-methyltransferase